MGPVEVVKNGPQPGQIGRGSPPRPTLLSTSKTVCQQPIPGLGHLPLAEDGWNKSPSNAGPPAGSPSPTGRNRAPAHLAELDAQPNIQGYNPIRSSGRFTSLRWCHPTRHRRRERPTTGAQEVFGALRRDDGCEQWRSGQSCPSHRSAEPSVKAGAVGTVGDRVAGGAFIVIPTCGAHVCGASCWSARTARPAPLQGPRHPA